MWHRGAVFSRRTRKAPVNNRRWTRRFPRAKLCARRGRPRTLNRRCETISKDGLAGSFTFNSSHRICQAANEALVPEAACIDKPIGAQLAILNYSFSRSTAERKAAYRQHLRDCKYCSGLKRKERLKNRGSGLLNILTAILMAALAYFTVPPGAFAVLWLFSAVWLFIGLSRLVSGKGLNDAATALFMRQRKSCSRSYAVDENCIDPAIGNQLGILGYSFTKSDQKHKVTYRNHLKNCSYCSNASRKAGYRNRARGVMNIGGAILLFFFGWAFLVVPPVRV